MKEQRMTAIEIATGAAIAAQNAVNYARECNQVEQKYGVDGSRHLTYANANAAVLEEAYEALELAIKKLFQVKDREARMLEL